MKSEHLLYKSWIVRTLAAQLHAYISAWKSGPGPSCDTGQGFGCPWHVSQNKLDQS